MFLFACGKGIFRFSLCITWGLRLKHLNENDKVEVAGQGAFTNGTLFILKKISIVATVC